MWQKCPICNGEGRVTANSYSSSVFQQCTVCNGMKIINKITGLPPDYIRIADVNVYPSKEQLFREDLDTLISGE
jgi:excinuclease UvrABC ATPase subunit